MKTNILTRWAAALCLSAIIAQAQETPESQKFEERLKQLQESFEKQQKEMRENFERMMREQQSQIEELKRQIAVATNAPPAMADTNTPVLAKQVKELNERVDQVSENQKKTRPNEFNPSIGFVGESIVSYNNQPNTATGSPRPGGWDFWQRTMELDLAASVDPFAKGYAVLNASADTATGEASVGVEEAAIQTTSLPWNLELKGGRFFGEFGRLSYVHDHELPFVNRPLVLDNYIGGESQTDGLQVNWLMPVPHYVTLTAGIGDKFGDDPNNPGAERPFGGLSFWSRLGTYFDLTSNWQLEGGVSGLWNPEAGSGVEPLTLADGTTATQLERRVAGMDLKLSYVPLQENQFKSFTWGTEFLFSDNNYRFQPELGNPSTSFVSSYGLYSYFTYKWSREWSAGFLFDWVQNADNNNAQTFAYSPYLTYAISHWNQLRLQYTYTQPNAATGYKDSSAVYLQWVWIIGSHSHGWSGR